MVRRFDSIHNVTSLSCSECANGRRESTSSPTPSPTPDVEGLSTPDTGSMKDGGFYVLRKDSERRSTLVKALVEDEDAVRSNGCAWSRGKMMIK